MTCCSIDIDRVCSIVCQRQYAVSFAFTEVAEKWLGPFAAIECVGKVAHELLLPASMTCIRPVSHVMLLRLYKDGECQASPPAAVLPDDTHQMLAHTESRHAKKHKHQREFFVSWKGMGHAHSGWRPDSEPTNAAEVVQDHLDTHGQWTTGQAGCWCRHANTVKPKSVCSSDLADADAAQGTSTDMDRRRKTLSQKAECQRWYSQDSCC